MAPSGLHVLMTTDAVGGVWTYSLTLLRALRPAHITFTLAVLGPAPSAAEARELAALPHVDLAAHDGRLEWMPGSDADVRASGEWLLELAKGRPPDVVHVNGFAHAALPFDAPVVCVAHSCVRSWWRAVHGAAPPAEWDAYTKRVAAGLSAATVVVTPTTAMLDALRDEYDFAGPSLVVFNGLPPVKARRPKEPRVFAAGRVWDQAKNIAALDRAAPAIRWPIEVAGSWRDFDGHDRRPFHLQATGRLEPAALRARLAGAAIYASPARYEPFGLSVLEAAQEACALVLGDIPSLRELWDGAAIFAPPDDEAALAEAITGLIDAPERRADWGRAAARRAARYSDRPMADRYGQIYRALAVQTREAGSCAS